jgi:hypothetical protein
MLQIIDASPLHWQIVKAKISISPSLAELIHHSSYNSFSWPKILPSTPQIFTCPLTLTFPFIFKKTLFIKKSIKISKTSKK